MPRRAAVALLLAALAVAAALAVPLAPAARGCAPERVGDDRWRIPLACFEAEGSCGHDPGLVPHAVCVLLARDVRVPVTGRFATVAARVEAPRGDAVVTLLLGRDVAGVAHVAAGDPLERPVDARVTVPAGSHDIRVLVSAGDGRLPAPVRIRHVDVLVGCENRAPLPPTVLGADGMGPAADHGWKDHGYRFRGVAAEDPDGDPVLLAWDFGDGTTARGAEAHHAFGAAGLHEVTLVARDDPSVRPGCALVNGKASASEPLAFRAMTEWRATLTGPPACAAGRPVESPLGVMAGACALVARVEGAPDALVAGATFRVDRRPYAEDATPPWSAEYESLDHDAGVRQLDACFTAHADKYRRSFCSASSTRANVGRP